MPAMTAARSENRVLIVEEWRLDDFDVPLRVIAL